MKKTSHSVQTCSNAYRGHWFRCITAAVSAHLIVAYGEKETFAELIVLPAYYPAFGISFLVAIVIINIIYRSTRYLDQRLPWERALHKRCYAQLIWGVALPLLLDCFFVDLYYRYHGTDIIAAGHFKYNFTVIILMVLLLNAYYIIFYLLKLRLFRSLRGSPPSIPGLEHFGQLVMVFSKKKICVGVDRDGNEKVLEGTLEQILHDLPIADYFLINRSCIIERSIILATLPGGSRTIKLKLNLKIYQEQKVSQRQATAFRAWQDYNFRN